MLFKTYLNFAALFLTLCLDLVTWPNSTEFKKSIKLCFISYIEHGINANFLPFTDRVYVHLQRRMVMTGF